MQDLLTLLCLVVAAGIALAACTVIRSAQRASLREGYRGLATDEGKQLWLAISEARAELEEAAAQIFAEMDRREATLRRLMVEGETRHAERGIQGAERGTEGGERNARDGERGTKNEAQGVRSAEPGPVDAAFHIPRSAFIERVYHLADEGRAPGQIAETVGTCRGEVEVLLSLRAAQRH
ncbi:MAG: hypothetical protein HY320_11975 [Armatimonadetes bacterium]|nr:hypothetical protein [Armatimonadota bacterium]